MFNSFPIPEPDVGGGQWVHDWSAYQTICDLTGTTVTVPASTWQTFVNVTGKGFFKWCRASDTNSVSSNPNIRLTIDGQVYQFDGVVAGSNNQGNEINFEIPFKTSLKIEAFNSHATNAVNMMCDYLYMLQQSNPNASKVTLLQQSQRKMAYLTGNSTTLVDLLNITGSGYLLSARFLGYYSTAASPIYGDIAIDGVQKMTNRYLSSINQSSIKQSEVVGPMRFNNSLRIKTRTDATGTPYICEAWYSLD